VRIENGLSECCGTLFWTGKGKIRVGISLSSSGSTMIRSGIRLFRLGKAMIHIGKSLFRCS
jgi:hypothetical protein